MGDAVSDSLPRPLPPWPEALQRLRRLTLPQISNSICILHSSICNPLSPRLNYFRIFLTFARNSIVRDMTFRANFLIDCVSTITWSLMDLGFYVLVVFRQTSQIGQDTGWGEWEFYTFLATTKLINGLVQAFFMPNCEEVSELIRTGNFDFALLKPIDTQFLIS